MTEEKKEPEGIPWFTLMIVFVSFVIMGLVVWQTTAHLFDDSIETHLKHEITQMDNVSDDYVQGWLDCVDEYHKWIRRAQNITNQLANQTSSLQS